MFGGSVSSMFGLKNEKVETNVVIGEIYKIGNVKVNNRALGLVKYNVGGKDYEVRMPVRLQKELEEKYKEHDEDLKIKRLKYNLTSFYLTRIIGKRVLVQYNVDNPKKATVLREYE